MDNTFQEPTELSKISEDGNSDLKSPYINLRLNQFKSQLKQDMEISSNTS